MEYYETTILRIDYYQKKKRINNDLKYKGSYLSYLKSYRQNRVEEETPNMNPHQGTTHLKEIVDDSITTTFK